MMNSLSLNEVERQMAGHFLIAPDGIGREILFRINAFGICLPKELSQNLDRSAFAKDQVGTALTQIAVECMQTFIQEIPASPG